MIGKVFYMEKLETESNIKSFDLQDEPGPSSSNVASGDIEKLLQQIDQVKKDKELPKIKRRKRLRALNRKLNCRPRAKNKTEKSGAESDHKLFELQVEPGTSSSNVASGDIEKLLQQIDQVKKDKELITRRITRRKRLNALYQALHRRRRAKNQTEKQKKGHQQRMKKCRSKLSEPEKSSLEEQEEDDPFNDKALMEMSIRDLNRRMKDYQISGARQAAFRLKRICLKNRGKKFLIESLVKIDNNLMNFDQNFILDDIVNNLLSAYAKKQRQRMKQCRRSLVEDYKANKEGLQEYAHRQAEYEYLKNRLDTEKSKNCKGKDHRNKEIYNKTEILT